MKFEWDEAKARANLAKHGVSFELATRVWDDPLYEVSLDRIVDGEERWLAIGVVRAATLVVVVHVYPDRQDEQHVRIIGARRATTRERRDHED